MKQGWWLAAASLSLAALPLGAAEEGAKPEAPDKPAKSEKPAREKPAKVAEVGPRDWAYQAVQGLAERGLVHGYKDAKFLGGKKLTRFEMASLVKRILDNVMQLPTPSDGRPLETESPGTAAGRGQRGPEDVFPTGRLTGGGARLVGFTEEDLATAQRLVDDYSVELAVIGADLEQATARMQALEGRVAEVEKALKDPKGPLQKVISDVARIDRVRLTGYIQSRYESFENTREADPEDDRGPITDRFMLRRVRLTVNARPTDKTAIKWQFDGAPNNVETRDAWIDYYFSGNPATGPTASIGQMKIPFGFEVVQSSSVREASERARIIRFFYPGERDRGAKIAGATGGKIFWEVGAFNGVIGPGRPGLNVNDNNNDKNIAGRIRTTLAKKLDLGVSFDLGTSLRTALVTGEDPKARPVDSANPLEEERLTLGADFQYYLNKRTKFQGELVWGKVNGVEAAGYILQAAHFVTPKNQLVVKYDWFGADDRVLSPVGAGGTPVNDAVPYEGTLSNLSFGVIHHLASSTRVKLFYELHTHGREVLEYGRVPWQGNVLRLEVITLF